LFEHNPLSAICSIVCDHKRQCYGNCILGIKKEPIPFYKMEEELSYDYLMNHTFQTPVFNQKRIAIVGAGAVGISASILLALKGYQVTLFDDHARIGGVMRYGIPDFRLPRVILDRYEVILQQLQVAFRPNTMIGQALTLAQLSQDYDAVLIGTGAVVANQLRIKGEALGHVHYAIDYLKDPEAYTLNQRVIVLGAGNVAMDAARTSARNGHHTSIYYRKSAQDMKANEVEVQETIDDGVDFVFFQSPVEITKEGIIFCDSENYTDEQGRLQTKILYGTEHLVTCDSVIIAVSQSPNPIVYRNSDLAITKQNRILVDEVGRTNLANVYACGDTVTGARSVVEAVAHTKEVVSALIEDLQTK
ncbi:MAG: FAD-dependent oxidoreductase, partial [Erysipelotrichaceae bacterium]|nr:FAD-dependent oxidoreductase [Erysipelotrichaceae bacterium]